MKNLFPGHFKDSENTLKNIWEECIFAFDANILLNLYRYSDTTRSEFLKILKRLNGRIWLPNRAAEEYLNNRLSVIDQQEKSYDTTISSIDKLRKSLSNARQHPFVCDETLDKAKKLFDDLCNELTENQKTHTKRIHDDSIKISISELFEEQVGSPYDKQKLEDIIKDGEARYKQKIPPGFKDASKQKDSDIFLEKCQKYGDLIVWYQVIEKSKETNKDVILVTDDKKEDWWQRFNGKTIGPHPDLVKEFQEKTSKKFYMYQADRFLELARTNLNEDISNEIVEEIREVRRQDAIDSEIAKNFDEEIEKKIIYKKHLNQSEHIREQIIAIQQQISQIQHQIMTEEHKKHELHRLLDEGMTVTDEFELEETIENLSLLKNHLSQLHHVQESLYLQQQELNNMAATHNYHMKGIPQERTLDFRKR